jgi:phosphocarrier protein HPr
MLNKEVKIINKLGLHARASAKLVELANKFESNIWLDKDGKKANAKSIMIVMMLAASYGSSLTITVDGADEAEALIAIEELINNKFGELD